MQSNKNVYIQHKKFILKYMHFSSDNNKSLTGYYISVALYIDTRSATAVLFQTKT